MRETAKKARKSQILPEEDKEEIEAALRRMESKELARKNKEREGRAMKEWKKEEERKRGEGKKEFFLKKGQSVVAWLARLRCGADWCLSVVVPQLTGSRSCSRPSSTSWRPTRRRCARRSSASARRPAQRRRSSFPTGDRPPRPGITGGAIRRWQLLSVVAMCHVYLVAQVIVEDFGKECAAVWVWRRLRQRVAQAMAPLRTLRGLPLPPALANRLAWYAPPAQMYANLNQVMRVN